MESVKSKVSRVVSEAKNVLQDTGRIVHGIKRVINGAKMLTEFTKNAVKFAKYFAMEPNNATVDFFEEKAVMAVLEAQKAAAEAKIAAVEAKEATKKVKRLMRNMKKKKGLKSSKKLGKVMKYLDNQAHRAEMLAEMTSGKEKEARKDAVVVDGALRKMIQLAKAEKQKEENEKKDELENESENEKEINEEEEIGDELGAGKEKKKLNDVEGEDKKQNQNKEEADKEEKEKEEVAQHAMNSLKNMSKNDEEGSGNDVIKHNETAKAESNSKYAPYDKKNKTASLKGSELPELFYGGGDENDVISNDFEQEGFSIPEGNSEKKVNEVEKEITSLLDKLAEKKVTKSENLQQLLKAENETSANAKSTIKETAENGSNKGLNDSTKHDSTKNAIVDDKPNTSISSDAEEEVERIGADSKNNAGLLSTTPSTKNTLFTPTKLMTGSKRANTLSPSNQEADSNLVEKKVARVDKGPVNLVVSVTRRLLTDGKKAFSSKKNKKLKTEDLPTDDPFNFKSLETKKHKNTKKQKYIVDKEDAGRAGLTGNYVASREVATKSSVPQINTVPNSEPSAIYDNKPPEVLTQI